MLFAMPNDIGASSRSDSLTPPTNGPEDAAAGTFTLPISRPRKQDAPMDESAGDLPKAVRSVPTFGRGTCLYRGVLRGDPSSGQDHDFTVYAYFSVDGFEVTTHDGGRWPADEVHSALWVEPEHVDALVSALGGRSGDDPVWLLARRIEEGVVPVKAGEQVEYASIDAWFSERGVHYTTGSKRVSNL